MAASKNIRYIPAIDHLRAYAALLVLLFHMGYRRGGLWPVAGNPFTSFIYEGHSGVALFLVLSGFLFTYGSAGREIDYKTFLLNRVLRIYPLMITLVVIGVSAFGNPLSVTQVVETLLPVQNLHGNTPTTPLGMYNAVFWTISVECQFYLIFPFLHRQLLARGIRGLMPLLAFLLLARWSTYLFGANPQEVSYFTIIGRLDQFLVGMIAATIALRVTFAARWLRWSLPLGLGGLWVALFLYNRAGGLSVAAGWKIFWPPVEATLWALIVLGYLAVAQGWNGLVSKVLAGVGTVSYSMYLIHASVIILMASYGCIFQIPGSLFLSDLISGLTCCFPVALLVSILSYQAIEKPFLGLRRKYLESASTPPATPGVRAPADGDRREEGIPGVRWMIAGLAAVSVVFPTVAFYTERARARDEAFAAAHVLQRSVERAMAASDASHPSACKVLLVPGGDVSLALDVGRQLAGAGEAFIVPGPHGKDGLGADHDWPSLSAKTLRNGLSPWYVLPGGATRRGVPATAPVFPLGKELVLSLTPPTLELSAVGSTAEINLVSHGNAADYVLGGWSNPDPGGTWTVETWAALAFRPQIVQGKNVEVFVDALPALSPAHDLVRQRVRLYFNGTPIGSEQWLAAAGTVPFVIPAATWNAAGKGDAQASLAFELPDAVAPATLDPQGGNDDVRKLGLFVSRVRLRVVP